MIEGWLEILGLWRLLSSKVSDVDSKSIRTENWCLDLASLTIPVSSYAWHPISRALVWLRESVSLRQTHLRFIPLEYPFCAWQFFAYHFSAQNPMMLAWCHLMLVEDQTWSFRQAFAHFEHWLYWASCICQIPWCTQWPHGPDRGSANQSVWFHPSGLLWRWRNSQGVSLEVRRP